MHSKVVIASLVCMLAASFGAGNKVTSDFKKTNRETKEMVCRAPNDDDSELVFVNDITSTDDEARTIFTSNKAIARARVIEATPGVNVRFEYSNDCVEVYITPNRTETKQVVALGFLPVGKKINATAITKTVYIYNDGQHCCFSALSEADALAKYFMNYVATPEQAAALANGSPSFEGTSSGIVGPEFPYTPEPDPHPNPWPPFPNPNPPRVKKGFLGGEGFDFIEPSIPFDPFTPGAEESYVNFIFGDKQDMEFTVSTVSNSGINQRVGTGLNAQVNWYDENNVMHPAKGVSVQFYGNGELLTDFGHIFSQEPMSYDYRTNANGYCNVDVRSDCRLNLIEARVCADSSSTRVEDNFMIDYPFFARAASDPFAFELSDYAEVYFTINIYSKKSERGEAFAMSQMQNVPYDYCAQFTDGVDAVKTVYPSAHTYYDGANDTIMVQPEDKKSWDVLNHEYGHYIADQLELCNITNSRTTHSVLEDLTATYGDVAGKQLAYNEGLATYLGIASQMFYANRYNNFVYADERYEDDFRNVSVDYNSYALGVQNNCTKAEGIEVCVTGTLLKLLDNIEREFDTVTLGHQAMWEALLDAEESSSVTDLLVSILNLNVSNAPAIKKLLAKECMLLTLEEVTTDEWTIMIYMCGSNLESQVARASLDITEILSVSGQPDNVNIIIETGGAKAWEVTHGIDSRYLERYHVENQELVLDSQEPLADMAREETFESFLEWGVTYYPAKKMGLLFWDHGCALDGCCYDENFEDDDDNFLLASEVAEAFDNVLTKKLEFVGYDCCFMQVQDIAEINSHYSKYMVASEQSIPANGWKYDEWIDNLYELDDTETILVEIANTYAAYYDCDYVIPGKGGDIGFAGHPDTISVVSNYCTLSVLDLSKMEAYYSAFETLAEAIEDTVKADFCTFRDDILYQSRTFGGQDGFASCGTLDALDFLDHLLEHQSYQEYRSLIYAAWNACYRMITFNATGTKEHDAYGLALHVKTENGHTYDASETNFVNWRNLFF